MPILPVFMPNVIYQVQMDFLIDLPHQWLRNDIKMANGFLTWWSYFKSYQIDSYWIDQQPLDASWLHQC